MSNHKERNDAIKDNNKIAIDRYKFAIKCLKGRNLIIVDVGCGYGYGTDMLNKAGHEVFGIDNSEDAIKYANKNYPGTYIQRDAEKKVPGGFEVTVCLETLCHLKNPLKFIKNITTKELIISAPIDPNPNDGYPWRLHNLSRDQFEEMLEDWFIVDELLQKSKPNYLTLYCKKKYE